MDSVTMTTSTASPLTITLPGNDVPPVTMKPNFNHLDGYDKEVLDGLDYTIVAFLLIISVGIGAFYAWKDRDLEEDNYMMGGRQMKVWPSAISLVATFIPSTGVVGEYTLTCFNSVVHSLTTTFFVKKL
jgi:hypothetical protein